MSTTEESILATERVAAEQHKLYVNLPQDQKDAILSAAIASALILQVSASAGAISESVYRSARESAAIACLGLVVAVVGPDAVRPIVKDMTAYLCRLADSISAKRGGAVSAAGALFPPVGRGQA